MNYKINNNLTFRKIADEYFVLNRDTGYVHTFNNTGALIWENIVRHAPFDEIVNNFTIEYTVSLESVKSDFTDFFQSLEEKQLITILDKT